MVAGVAAVHGVQRGDLGCLVGVAMNMTNIGESEQQLDTGLEAAFKEAIKARVALIGKQPEQIREALIVNGCRLLVLLDDDTYLEAEFELEGDAAGCDHDVSSMTLQ